MRLSTSRAAAILLLILVLPTAAFAQSAPPPKEDHVIVYEIGWAGSWSHDERWQTKGATFAFEVTPIEDRLEIEAGVTAIRSRGVTETSADILFKKPWTLSKHVEFMAGVGPESCTRPARARSRACRPSRTSCSGHEGTSAGISSPAGRWISRRRGDSRGSPSRAG